MSETKVPTMQEIVETVLKDVEWMGETKARCKCPGRHKHTTRSHKNDCFVFTNGVPTVSCLHDSCRDEVAKANLEIRNAFNLFSPIVDEKAVALGKEKAAKRHVLEAKAKASLPEILKQYSWDYGLVSQTAEKWWSNERPKNHLESFLNLFKPEDILWFGDPQDSGREENKKNFVSRLEAQALNELFGFQGRYTTASTYKPESFSRTNANVLSTPFFVVEGDRVVGEVVTDEDKLKNKNACLAVFRWLKDSVGLELRAVVDAANRSLHGWFTYPTEEKAEELRIILPAMNFDRATFKPSQPLRLPGGIRENGKLQRLIYLK